MENNAGNGTGHAAADAAAAGGINQSPANSDVTHEISNHLPPQPDTTSTQRQELPSTSSTDDKKESSTTSGDSTPAADTMTTPPATAEAVPVSNGETEVRTRPHELTAVDKLREHDVTVDDIPSAAAVIASAAGEPTNGIHKMSTHDMDMAELKVKILCQEKNNMALKMELKCAELQVAAKEKLDLKKTRLIELLDTKLTALEKKNLRLVEMMEQLVKDKEAQSHRLMDAAKTLENAAKRLADSERIRGQLQAMNSELKTMLENVEGKGSQLAKLAKEKVLKYKEENERMQKQLDDLKGGDDCSEVQSLASAGSLEEFQATSAPAGDVIDAAIGTMEDFRRRVQTALTAVNNWKQDTPTDALKGALDDVGRASEEQLTAASGVLSRLKSSAATTTSNLDEKTTNGTGSMSPSNDSELAEKMASKDREIENLKEELSRLKAAIGQLVGLK